MAGLTFLLRSVRFFCNRIASNSPRLWRVLDFRYCLIIDSRVAWVFIRIISRTDSSREGYSGWIARKSLTKTLVADLFHTLAGVPSKCTLKWMGSQHGPEPGSNAFASCSVTVFFIQLAGVMRFRMCSRIRCWVGVSQAERKNAETYRQHILPLVATLGSPTPTSPRSRINLFYISIIPGVLGTRSNRGARSRTKAIDDHLCHFPLAHSN